MLCETHLQTLLHNDASRILSKAETDLPEKRKQCSSFCRLSHLPTCPPLIDPLWSLVLTWILMWTTLGFSVVKCLCTIKKQTDLSVVWLQLLANSSFTDLARVEQKEVNSFQTCTSSFTMDIHSLFFHQDPIALFSLHSR